MKPLGRSLLASALVAWALLLVACHGALSPAASRGSLTVAVHDAVARTLVPGIDMTTASYLLTGTGPGGATFSRTLVGNDSTTIDQLAFGSWSVTAEALNADAVKIGAATGTTEVGATAATLPLTVRPFEGFGNLDLSLTWPLADVLTPVVEAGLLPLSGSQRNLPFSLVPGAGLATFSAADVSTGYHTLSLRLLDGSTVVAGAVEVVRIVKGETTGGTFLFDAVNRIGGNLNVQISPELGDPLEVTVLGGVASIVTGQSLVLSLQVAGNPGNLTTVWYVNGVPQSTAGVFNFSGWPLGTYRVDATAFTADGKRAGSSTLRLRVEAPTNGSQTQVFNSRSATWQAPQAMTSVPNTTTFLFTNTHSWFAWVPGAPVYQAWRGTGWQDGSLTGDGYGVPAMPPVEPTLITEARFQQFRLVDAEGNVWDSTISYPTSLWQTQPTTTLESGYRLVRFESDQTNDLFPIVGWKPGLPLRTFEGLVWDNLSAAGMPSASVPAGTFDLVFTHNLWIAVGETFQIWDTASSAWRTAQASDGLPVSVPLGVKTLHFDRVAQQWMLSFNDGGIRYWFAYASLWAVPFPETGSTHDVAHWFQRDAGSQVLTTAGQVLGLSPLSGQFTTGFAVSPPANVDRIIGNGSALYAVTLSGDLYEIDIFSGTSSPARLMGSSLAVQNVPADTKFLFQSSGTDANQAHWSQYAIDASNQLWECADGQLWTPITSSKTTGYGNLGPLPAGAVVADALSNTGISQGNIYLVLNGALYTQANIGAAEDWVVVQSGSFQGTLPAGTRQVQRDHWGNWVVRR